MATKKTRKQKTSKAVSRKISKLRSEGIPQRIAVPRAINIVKQRRKKK